jgi:hypothetical protein
MKFLLLVMMTLFVGACAHKHGGATACGCNKTMEEKQACGCGMGAGTADATKPAACACEGKKHYHDHDKQKRECCSEKTCSDHKGHAGHESCQMDTNALMSDKITQKISQEEFAKLYTTNKEKLGKTCTTPAMTYCGKTTKDTMISEGEASCLWTKVFRVSRDTMPELDGTPCAKMIKSFAKK